MERYKRIFKEARIKKEYADKFEKWLKTEASHFLK